MGDMILASPALRQLRQSCPDAKITFMANPIGKAIYQGSDLFDDWIIYNKKDNHRKVARQLRTLKFDAVILLVNSFRSALLMKLAGIPKRIGYNRDGRKFLLTDTINTIKINGRHAVISMHAYYGHLMQLAIESLGTNPAKISNKMELTTTENDILNTDKLLANWNIDPQKLIVFVPGGAFGGSKWWPADKFAALADKLSNDGYHIMLSCAPNEPERKVAEQIIKKANCQIYNLLDTKIDLGTLKEITNRCRLMVSNDTGPCHIAAAFDTPLVTIFGPTDPRWTATGYKNEIRLRIDVDCGPCQKSICQTDHRCMNIDVKTVYDAACQVLAGKFAQNKSIFDRTYQAYNENHVPLKDNSGLVHEDFKTILDSNKLGTIEEVFQSELTTLNENNIDLTIERFESAQGVKEFSATMHYSCNGIATDRPVAFGQETGLFGIKRSFVISQKQPPEIYAEMFDNKTLATAQNLRKHFDPDNKLTIFLFAAEDFQTNGLDWLIETAAIVAQNKKDDFKIIVLGSDDYSHYFQKAKSLYLENKILFMGTTQQLPAMIQMADVGILPAITPTKSKFIALCSACQKPVITTLIGYGAKGTQNTIIIEKINNKNQLATALKNCQKQGKTGKKWRKM
ncbi:MAG: lipopolysaccharide heptosyltransferase II [Phycisphaerae bacterium]|nr:lipopolysaccharide heptosyltransferase II [Phycisphaerae bacterium]